MNIALIPARIGSKGVPRKNIRSIGGIPLIAYTIQAALHAPNIDSVYVTTECAEIAAVAHEYGANVLMRPDALAQDHVQTDEVFLFALRQLQEQGVQPKCLVLLQPTNPFRTWEHIQRSVEMFYENGCESTIVSGYRDTGFHWVADMDDTYQPIFHDPMQRMGRQDIDEREWLVKESGSIYVVDAVEFSKYRCYRLPPYQFFLMSPEDSVDIDTPDDFERAVELMEKRK